MPKSPNGSASASVRITLSRQSHELLEMLAKEGIYGRNPAEVAGRFIDQALQGFVETPKLKPRKIGERG